MEHAGSTSADSPSPDTSSNKCVGKIDSNWRVAANTKSNACKGASFTDKNVQIGAKTAGPMKKVVGPFSEVDPNGKLVLIAD